MVTAFEVVLIAIGLLAVCLITIYLYSIRINNCVQLDTRRNLNEENEAIKESSSNSNNQLLEKKSKKKPKIQKNREPLSQEIENSSKTEPAAISIDHNDEDDIIALATLKGYNISGIRRRPDNHVRTIVTDKPLTDISVNISKKSPKTNVISASSEAEIVVPKSLSSEFVIFENKAKFEQTQSHTPDDISWSHVPTREEEINKSLKSKLMIVQSDLEISESKLNEATRNLEQFQKRSGLLEIELNEQRKNFNAVKSAADSQLKTAMAHNLVLTNKISKMECDINNSEVLKESTSRLQAELQKVHGEKHDLLRELAEIKHENEFLRDHSFFVDSLRNKCADLEQELEDKNNELVLQTETSQVELKLTRAKLESEIAFHRAEHANSVGSSTALHQEISQLKSEISNLTVSNEILRAKTENLEQLNQENFQKLEEKHRISDEASKQEIGNLKLQLANTENSLKSVTVSFEEQADSSSSELEAIKYECLVLKTNLDDSESRMKALSFEISSLQSDLSARDAELSALNSGIASTSSISPDSEIGSLRNHLAEAEIKISSLQSDLAREIKRADISKKVYEAKLASLN